MTMFKPGDNVKLKSGGPKMTIEEEVHKAPGKYFCIWFDDNIRKREIFSGDTLEKVGPEKVSIELKRG
jgi:uncharacterized protein YodC (DUF2158 family)